MGHEGLRRSLTQQPAAMHHILPLALLLILLLPLPAQAEWTWTRNQEGQIQTLEKKVGKGDGFAYKLEGKHWTVETAVSARFTAELALFMDLFTNAFGDLLSGLETSPLIPRKPAIQVFATKTAYEEKHAKGTRGYYGYRWDEAGNWVELHLYTYIADPKERDFTRFYHPILLHEGTHVLLRRLLGKAGNHKWFDEGVAAYFQFWDLSVDVRGNRSSRYLLSFYRPYLAKAFRTGTPRLSDLLEIGEDDWNPDRMGPIAKEHYALAESVIDFMLSSRRGAAHFKLAFARMRAGEAPLLSRAELVEIEPDWQQHVRGLVGVR